MSDLLEISELNIGFPSPRGLLKAVRNLSFTVPFSAITCLVGESGCGKSLTCRAILQLTPDYAVLDGQIRFQGKNLLASNAIRKYRGSAIGMIFQEPMTSLNPVLTVGDQTSECLRLHLHMSRKQAKTRVIELFEQVGIPAAENRYNSYPHQLSGGMRQRVMIAIAISCKPSLLLADEPTTALDATIQGQILDLIKEESTANKMSVLLITHDLGIVAEVADYVGVMYAGMLMEYASAQNLFENPLHPYTQGLMAAQPTRDSVNLYILPTIPGTVPTLAQMPPGCPFQPRCSKAMPICCTMPPQPVVFEDRRVSCWLYDKKYRFSR